MARPEIASAQIGKQGLTSGMIDLIENMFQNHELVKVAVLKTCTRDRDEIKKLAQDLCNELIKRFKKEFNFRIVGFTIFMRKWRKAAKS